MTANSFPPLVCESCKGVGRIDVGTEDEGPCGEAYCHEGELICTSCNDHSGSDEPAVGLFFRWNDYVERDDVFPLCRRHLQQAHDFADRGGL